MIQSEALAELASLQPPPGKPHATRPWGSWTVLVDAPGYRVRVIDVLPSQRTGLHYHCHRSEHWVVVAGTARVVIGQHAHDMHLMQSVLIPARTIHRIENPYSEPLQIVEVQRGDRLDEEDIVNLEDDQQHIHLVRGSRP
jgi:mannose-6-phosphate isomerase-like protein (cupin superfamily)